MIPKDKIKLKKCKECGDLFSPPNSIRKVCFKYECQVAFATAHAKKVAAVREKRERQALREAKERIKRRSEWLEDAQRWFNKFVRLRDAEDPCISCKRTDDRVEWVVGGKWDCGHFLSRGSHPELRFEELNAHKQCKKCNGGAGKFARKNRTVSQEYRANLINKIGLEKVEWLEGPHEARHYTIDELKQLIAHYKMKCKELEKEK